MKKKTLMLAAAGLLLAATTAEAATGIIKASLFEGRIVVNNRDVRENGREMTFLNYEGNVYVPLRKFGEASQAFVGYEKESKTAFVDWESPINAKSELHDRDSNEQFELKIFSGKSLYEEGEPLQIWSRLEYEGSTPISTYPGPLIKYTIVDGDGFRAEQLFGLSLNKTDFNPGDEYTNSFGVYGVVNYRGFKASNGLLDLLKNDSRPAELPKGKYKVTATFKYSTEFNYLDSLRELSASLEFEIE